MTFKLLVSTLCAREGKKHQINIADMSEIAKHMMRLLNEMPLGEAGSMIAKYGKGGKR